VKTRTRGAINEGSDRVCFYVLLLFVVILPLKLHSFYITIFYDHLNTFAAKRISFDQLLDARQTQLIPSQGSVDVRTWWRQRTASVRMGNGRRATTAVTASSMVLSHCPDSVVVIGEPVASSILSHS
jgi:hypothetical protein